MNAGRTVPEGIDGIVYDERAIATAVARLARDVANDVGAEPVTLVGVLKGALFFAADLARSLPPECDARLDFIVASSYGNTHRSSGEVRLLGDTSESVEGKNVIIVEDIVDNGLTLEYVRGLFASRRPKTLRSCVLLDKPYHRTVDVPVDFVGLEAPDAFIVGYGLDYQEKYRTLPYLARLDARAFDVGESSLRRTS